jgi:uncharacterized protein
MSEITVYKLNHLGEEVWHYTGEEVARGETWVCLEARFNRDDMDQGFVVFRRGDLMTEWFYSDRWYNIFRIQDVDTGKLKGWYCNIVRPAKITETTVAAEDLALDVFIKPDGQVLVLDEDEFSALHLSPDDQAASWAAVDQLRAATQECRPPFDEINGE